MRINRLVFFNVAILTTFVLLTKPVAACGGFEFFSPKDLGTHSTNNTNVFVRWENGKQIYILQPDFQGNSAEFGMVIPFPSKPTINEVAPTFFTDLQSLTEPSQDIETVSTYTSANVGAEPQKGVTVVETEEIGDYTTTTLTATSSNDLMEWLNENGFNYTERDKSNFDYYISKQGFYFVVLKISTGKEVAIEDKLLGQLDPIGFEFTSTVPTLSLRISASEHDDMDFRLFVAADQMYFVPGAKIDYSKRLLAKDVKNYKQLEPYVMSDDWITRMTVRMSPSIIEQDLYLFTTLAPLTVTKASERTILNRENLVAKSGVVIGETTVRFLSTSIIDPTIQRATPTTVPRPTNGKKPTPVPEITIAFKNQKIDEPDPWYKSRSLWILLATSAVVEIALGLILYIQIRKHEDKDAAK